MRYVRVTQCLVSIAVTLISHITMYNAVHRPTTAHSQNGFGLLPPHPLTLRPSPWSESLDKPLDALQLETVRPRQWCSALITMSIVNPSTNSRILQPSRAHICTHIPNCGERHQSAAELLRLQLRQRSPLPAHKPGINSLYLLVTRTVSQLSSVISKLYYLRRRTV